MKNLLKLRVQALLLTALFLIGIAGMLSAQKIAIIDAGSSGSRLYVYNLDGETLTSVYEDNGNAAPLHEVRNDATSVRTFLNTITTQYTPSDNSKIQLYVLATAGMRGKNNDIYRTIQQVSSELTHYELKGAMTISGRYEGLYAWIAANYQEGGIIINNSGNKLEFQSLQASTHGILEIGGASMQIAYKANGTGEDYIQRDGLGCIYSKSYLNYGINKIFEVFGHQCTYDFSSQLISLSPLSSQIKFWGLGKAVNAAVNHPKTWSEADDQYHSYMSWYYITEVMKKLNLTGKLEFLLSPPSWTKGAALDILLDNAPEMYNNN